MKANAPEKIYIVNDDSSIKREWYKTKQVGFDTTEYTRTDAFIKKACEWLKENAKYYSHPKYQGEELTDETYISEQLFYDFRKAMED